MKNIWIIANWKSNKTISEALSWVDAVGPKVPRRELFKVVVCPVFSDLETVKKNILVNNYPLLVGAQDLSPFDNGAYTGEESARILSEIVDFVILGHSERRKIFGETDEIVAEKVMQAQAQKILSLVCVQDKNTPIPKGVKLVAYEPVFAIGTGNPDTPENANKVAGIIKEKYGQDLEVLYGGSVIPENAKTFLQQENISGLLIGKTSLEPDEFVKIIDITSRV